MTTNKASIGCALTVALVTICVVILVGLHQSGGDYSVMLPGQYELVRTNASTIMIWSPKGIHRKCIVPPKIIKIGIQKKLILGLVENDSNSDPGFNSKAGYFIIDTTNKSVLLGLTQQEWNDALKKYGITKSPKLCKPSRTFGRHIEK